VVLHNFINVQNTMFDHYNNATNNTVQMYGPLSLVVMSLIAALVLWLMVSAIGEWTTGEMTMRRIMMFTIRVAILSTAASVVLITMLTGNPAP